MREGLGREMKVRQNQSCTAAALRVGRLQELPHCRNIPEHSGRACTSAGKRPGANPLLFAAGCNNVSLALARQKADE